MAQLTVPHYLGLLQSDPDDEAAVEGLRSALASDDPEVRGDDPVRLLEAARQSHEARNEHRAAAWLIEVEAGLVAEDDPALFVALQRELGRIRQEELLDDAGAKEAYAAALAMRPDDADLEGRIEQIAQVADQWEAIVERFLDEAKGASDATLKTSLLTRAAGLLWQYEPDDAVRDEQVDALFADALVADPAATRTARLHAETLRARRRHPDVAEVLVSAADAARNRDEKLHLYLRAARVFARVLEDDDRASSCFERVLDLAPGHDEALTYLVDYFTEAEQWDHLVALYEDALRARQRLESEEGILLQIGMVHWRIRGRAGEAEPYFARLRKLDPAHPGMLEFYRDHLGAAGDDGRLLTILSDALRVTQDKADKAALGVEVARLAQGNEATLERAIDAWKAVQRLDPDNAEAHDALKNLYRRAERWNALVEVIKAEIDALGTGPEGRTERVALLREMVPIYRDRLQLDVMVINTYNAILQELPDDPASLDALATTYEAMGRWNDLIQVLSRQADAAATDDDKVALYQRVADLWIERFANYNQATQPLERVVAIDPENRAALAQLKEIYAKKRSWKSLFDVMQRESVLASDPDARTAIRVELARLAGDRLHRHDEAIRLWREVLADAPDTPGALDALEKVAEREKDWATLADVLERRADAAENDRDRIRVLQKLGTVAGGQLEDPARAAAAWKRVLELDPKNGRAMRTLRESFVAAEDWAGLEDLYADAEDWEGLVDVLGSAAEKTADPDLKVSLSFRAATIYEDRIGEPHRAFRNYERVLSVDPKNECAARALVPIYERDEKWSRLLGLHEVLLESLGPDGSVPERIELLRTLRSLALDKLGNEGRALDYAARAYTLDPTDSGLVEDLERTAQAAAGHGRLAELYLARLEALGDDADNPSHEDEVLRLRRRIAMLSDEKLGQAGEAILQLERILRASPEDLEAVSTLDRLYREQGRHEDLRQLYLHRVEHATHDAERHSLLSELARFEEDVLEDQVAAASRFEAILELSPDDEEALATLDRLYAAAERPGDLADVLERRRELAVAPGERRELTLRLAALHRDHLDAPDRALEAYGEVLDEHGTDGDAITGLESLAGDDHLAVEASRLLEPAYETLGAHRRLVDVLRRRLALIDDADEARELRLRIADLASAELDDWSTTYEMLEAVFLDRSDDVELWDRLEDAAARAGAEAALAEAFGTAIDRDGLPGSDLSVLAARVAALYDGVLGDPARAEPYHRRVLQHDPLADRAFTALKERYTNEERWEDLQVLYRNRIAQTVDVQAKLEHLLQVCFLFEEVLDEPDLAIRAHQEVLDLDPGHSASRRALRRLYQRTDRWRDLVALLQHDLDDAEGQDAVDTTFELGEIHERRLDEPGAAVDRYEAVLDAQPHHLRAQEALERLLPDPGQRQRIAGILEPLYTSQGAHAELVDVLGVQLEDTSDPGSRVALLLRIAELRETKLRQPAEAFSALAAAVVTDPGDGHARRELERLARVRGAQRERAAVLDDAIEAAAASSYLQAELQMELARLWGDALGDVDAAEAAWTRLVEIDGDNPDSVVPASEALALIHGERGDHRALATDLRRLVDYAPDPVARGGLLVRLAKLLEDELEDLPAAVEAQRERLDIDPMDREALLALERLYEKQSEWQRLIGVLQSRDAATVDPDEQRAIARRIGEVYETRLEDRDNAIVAYDDVVSRFGPDAETLRALARLYDDAESWQDLLEVLQMHLDLAASDDEAVALRFRIAELHRHQTRELERAIDGYGEILERTGGDHAGSIDALEALLDDEDSLARTAAARVLVPHFEQACRWEGLVRALEVLAAGDDPRERLDALRRGAEVVAERLDDPDRAVELTARAVRQAASEPDLGELLDRFDALTNRTERWDDAARALKEIAGEVVDGDLQVRVLLRVAELARKHLEDPALARDYYFRVLEQQPDHRLALDRLEELFEDRDEPEGLLDVLRRKTELAAEPDQRVWLLLRQAELSEQALDDPSGAIEAYERVLDEVERIEAYQGLERLYRRAERWDDLRALLERQLDAGVGVENDVRHVLGRTLLDHLDDPTGALDQLGRVLETPPVHAPTVETLEAVMASHPDHRARAAALLEPVYLGAMDWPKVVGALEARIAAEEDLVERRTLLRRLGEVQEDHLEDLDGALDGYARLFAEEPTDEDVWETLHRLARVLDRWPRLVEVARAALDEIPVDDEASARLAFRTGRVAEQKLGDLEGATVLYERALRFEPTDREAFAALEAVLARRGEWDDLLGVYQAQVDLAADDDERVETLHRIAEVEERRRDDADAAVDTLRRVLEVDPAEPRATDALDRILRDRERWDELADHFRHRVDQARDDVDARIALEFGLGELLASELEDVGAAVDVFEGILAERPDHPPTVAALEKLVLDTDNRLRITQALEPVYARADQWKKLVVIYEAQQELQDLPEDRVRLLGEIARLHERRGRDGALAFHAWARALEADPGDREVRAELDRLAQQQGSWDEHVQACEQAIAAAQNDPAVVTELLNEVARTHDERRGDQLAAIATYERLLEHDPDDPSPLDALEGLHTIIGDWTGLVDVLHRKVDGSFDPADRGDLLRRAGSVLEELVGDRAGAVASYRRALDEDETDPVALASLDRLHGAGAEWAELAEILERRLELADDPATRVELGMRLGLLRETELGDGEGAIDVFRRVLDDEPEHREAILRLGALFERKGRFDDLLDNLRLRASLAEDDTGRVPLLHRAGEVLERELDDVPSAITQYADALAVDEAHESTLAALLRIAMLADHRDEASRVLEPALERLGRWGDLVRVLEAKVETAPDPFDRRGLLRRIAGIEEEGRGDPGAAFDAVRRALAEDGSEPEVADELARLAEATDAWGDAAEAFARRAGAAGDPEDAASYYLREADAAENRLGDRERAVRATEDALAQVGDRPELLVSLDRLLKGLGRLRELAPVLERRVAVEDEPGTRADLWLRLAVVRRDILQDGPGTLGALREALLERPGDEVALGALTGLLDAEDDGLVADVVELLDESYRGLGRMDDVVALYDVRLRLADDDGERVGLLRDAAAIWEADLARPDEALAAWRSAFLLDPRDPQLLDEAERLAFEHGLLDGLRGVVEEAIQAHDGLDATARRDLRIRAAGWYRDHLADLDAAEEVLRAALDDDPGHRETHEALMALLRAQGRAAELVLALRAYAQVVPDEADRREHYREAAGLARDQVGRPSLAADCLEALLEVDPTDPQALRELAGIRRGQGEVASQVDLLERLVDVELDLEERRALRYRIADALETELGDRGRAVAAWRAVLDEDPADDRGFVELRRLLGVARDDQGVRELLERRIDDAASPEDRVAARLDLAGHLEQRFDDPEGAVAHLREAAEIDPHASGVLGELDRLYEQLGRWDALVDLLEDRVGAALDAGDRATTLTSLGRLATIQETRLGHPAQAMDTLERAVELDPGNAETLRRLVGLRERDPDAPDALAAALERLAGALPDDDLEAVDVLHRLADLAMETLGDPPRAEVALREGLRREGGGRSLERLRSHYETQKQHLELAELLAEEARRTSDPAARVALYRQVAGLYRDEVDDPVAAAGCLEQALALVPDDRDLVLELADLYLAAGRAEEAIRVLQGVIDGFGGKRKKEAALYHHRVGRAYEVIGDVQSALDAYDAAFRIDLSSVPVLRDLGRLCHAQGDYERAQKTFRALLLQKLDGTDGVTKADVYFYLGDICAKQGDPTKAVHMLERAVSEDGGHPEAEQLLSSLR